MRKGIRFAALIAAIVFCLAGCAKQPAPGSEEARILLPDPPEHPAEQILGDAGEAGVEMTLFYPAEDGLTLSEVTRTLHPEGGQSLIECAIDELIHANGFNLGRDAQFGVETASRIAIVDLPAQTVANRAGQDFYLLCASIANTLIASNEVDAVQILCGGQTSSVVGLPMGVFTAAVENPSAEYARLVSEAERLASDPFSTFSCMTPLYYPSEDGRYLLPEAREIQASAYDQPRSVIDALSLPPQRACCISAIPSNLELLAVPPDISVTKTGNAIVDLRFAAVLSNYLAFAGIEPWQFYGSIVLSLCAYLPEIDGVRIQIESDTVTSCVIAGRTTDFRDGIIRRRDFAGTIGSSAMLSFAADSGQLIRRECAIPRASDGSVPGILAALIEANTQDSVFPGGIRASDILGAYVSDRVATVNLSASFYAKCQSLNEAQERRLVYAMVNTLCTLPRVGAVRFIVEGRSVDSLSGALFLKGALMPDPGMYEPG